MKKSFLVNVKTQIILVTITIILIALMSIQIKDKPSFASEIWDGTSGITSDNTYTFSGGGGTELSPYLISTPEDLAQLASNVNAGLPAYNMAHYRVTCDIDLNDETFTFDHDTGLVIVTDGINIVYLGSGRKGDNSGLNNTFDYSPSAPGTFYIDMNRTEGVYDGAINTWTPIGNNSVFSMAILMEGDMA